MISRERIFGVALFLLPIALFAVLEVVLRLADYGGDQALFRETTISGKVFYAVNPDVTRRYFRTIQVRAMLSGDVFEKAKRSNTWRVFCLGESSTLGYPYFFNGTFPSMLRDRLESLWPEKNIEVINLGITAVNSHTVLDLLKELPRYGPDAVLVYCGHNEFYGALGAGSVESLGQRRWAVKMYLALLEWRSFRLVRDGLFAVKGIFTASPEQSREVTVMEGMVRDKEIAIESDVYSSAVRNFRANLEEIVSVAAESKIPLVLGTLVSNLGGMEPFASVFNEGTNDSQRVRWEEHFQAGRNAIAAKRYDDALRSLHAAVSIDSMPARVHFALGRAYEGAGQFQEAKEEYTHARDCDALRFRAPTVFNEIIREVAQQHNVPIAECERMIQDQSEHAIIGNRHMLEHVHLTIDGYFLLAKAFAIALAENGILAPKDNWHGERNLSDAEYRSRAGVTPFDSVAAAIRLYVLMNSWPFKEAGINARQFVAQTDLERLAKAYLVKEISWEEAHVKLAEQYERSGELHKAAVEYQALAKATPYNASPHLRLGSVLLDAGKMQEAEVSFRKALKIEESYFARRSLGFICMKTERYQEAIGELRTALSYARGIDPNESLQTRYFLAVALAAQGEYIEAQKTAESILASYPDFKPAQELSRRLRETLSNSPGKTP